MMTRAKSDTLQDRVATKRLIAHERLAISAHEIRNPAQALIGLTDMLCAMPLSAEAQACAKVIRQSAQAILTVVDDALDLVRLREGVIDFVAEPFDPRLVLIGTVEILHKQAAAKGLDLAGFSDPAVPARVIGDAGRIRQILLNLAGNAIKFTEEGGVGLALRNGPDGSLRFIVEDTGPGIADHERAALFTAFASHDAEQGGLGLGLAISAGIAGALGGSLSVEARAEGGTRVILSLPCTALEDADQQDTESKDKRPVLIVSNTPFTGPYLAEKLRALRHETSLIERPERAGLWLADHPDAVMLVDAALGRRGMNVAIHRALAVGCGAIALLRSLDEGQAWGEGRSWKPLAGEMEWPIIRKPVSGRHAALRLQALGRNEAMTPTLRAPTALIADDCPINRLLACRLLEEEGFQAISVADGTEAVETVAQRLSRQDEPFQLMLIDLRMPGLDGFMTAQQIRGVESLFLTPPAMMVGLSALVDTDIMAQGRAAGMDQIVAKPLNAVTLLRLRDAAQEKSVIQLSEMCKRSVVAAGTRR